MGRTPHGSSKANVRVRTPVQEKRLGIWEPHLETRKTAFVYLLVLTSGHRLSVGEK